MGEYQVIALKWRPQRFADVVGQEHVVTTLKNAVRRHRTAHAYLFVGPRGIGKTTTARIFAKALNCESPEDGEPCCRCNSCVTIANESNIDVREIDAASQNSVDSIRELREDAMHAPVNSRYKIYIIDEVHMLSNQAWNALLKTVEEPPPHVKFIFATTEVHQVLGTIISRCQRFDLQRISTTLICNRLRQIADAENVKISDGALEAVARAADGGMRDAQSLLDQMIAFFSNDGEEISEKQVLSLFGLSTTAEIERLLQAVFTNNAGEVIAAIHNLACRGKNLETLFNDLLAWLRAIQVCALIANPENILEDGREMIANYRRLAAQIKPALVQRLLEVLAPVGRTLHDAINKQVFLETIILKAMRRAHAVQIEDLIARLNQLRNRNELEVLRKVPSLAEQPTDYSVPTATVVAPPVPSPADDSRPEAPAAHQAPPAAPEPATTQSSEHRPAHQDARDHSPLRSESGPVIEAVSTETDNIEDVVIKTATDNGAVPELPTVTASAANAAGLPEQPSNHSGNSAAAPPEPTMTDDNSRFVDNNATEQTPEKEVAENLSAREIWHRMTVCLEGHRTANPQLKIYMLEATPESFTDSVLTVCFDDEYEFEHYQALSESKALLNKLLQEVVDDWAATVKLQKRPGIKKLSQTTSPAENDATEEEEEERKEENTAAGAPSEKRSLFFDEQVVKKASENDFVKCSLELFNGKIVDVHG